MIKFLSSALFCKVYLYFISFFKISDGIDDISFHRAVHFFRNHMEINYLSVYDQVEHDTGKAILIEICDKTLIRLGDAGSLCFFLYDTVQQIVRQMKEICFDLLPAYRVIDIHNKWFILEHCLKNLLQAFLPCLIRFLPLQRLRRILQARPFDKIVDILKMIIKRHPADAAVCRQIVDRNFVQRLFQKQLF